jgi:hypothetical protein
MKRLSINEEVVKLRKIMGITEVFANEETIEESWEVDPTYTHFAVSKTDGKIVNGWQYDAETDKESIAEYCKNDLKDMDLKPSDYKIATKGFMTKQGVDPFNTENWKSGVQETIEELSPSDIVNSMREEDMDTINELNLNNDTIKNFLKAISNDISIINNLGFNDFKSLAKYIMHGDIEDWNDLRSKAESYGLEVEPNVTEESFEDIDEIEAGFHKYEEDLSDCCGAPIIMGDICDACGEHCEAEVYDEEDDESEVYEELAMENIDEIEKELEEEEGSWMAMRAGKDGKIFEARAYAQETYFDTQSGALESAEDYALNRGYEADTTSFYPEHIKYGETRSYHIKLLKNGEPVKNKMLHISLYRMESGKYELTNYIN